MASDFAAVSLYPLAEIGKTELDSSQVEGYIMAYRHWLPNPSQTIGVRMIDDSMHPILPAGSIVAIDRSMTNPIAPWPDRRRPSRREPMIRWLEVSGRHMILRPNQQSREFPLVPVEISRTAPSLHHRPGRLVMEPVQQRLTGR